MTITKTMELNLKYKGRIPTVDVVQGDSVRALAVTLMSGDEPWPVPLGAAIVIRYRCADGTGGVYDTLPDGTAAYAVEGNCITVRLMPDAAAVPGTTHLQIAIIQEEQQISTFQMALCVEGQVWGERSPREYLNLAQWWSQQGGGGLPTGGKPGQVLELDAQGYAVWESLSGSVVGLDQVDNTPDSQKPVSGPQQDALDALCTQMQTYTDDAVAPVSVDYIVEQNVTNGWTYRKWNSGVAECWATQFTTPTQGAGVNVATVKLPFAFANTAYQVFLTPAETGLYVDKAADCNSPSLSMTHSTDAFTFSYYYEYSLLYNVSFHLHVIGRWK